MGILNSILSEIKSEVKSEIKNGARDITRDTIKDIKDSFKSDDKSKNVNNEEKYRKIFEDLKEKHGNNIQAIYSDSSYQELDAETKEYINRVLMPALEQTYNATVSAVNNINENTKSQMDSLQNHFDQANSDGNVTTEEQIEINRETFNVIGDGINEMANQSGDLMNSIGDVTKDIADKIDVPIISDTINEVSDIFKNEEYQKDLQDKFTTYGDAFKKNSDFTEKLVNAANSMEKNTEVLNEYSEFMQNNINTATENVGMSNDDLAKAFKEGEAGKAEEYANDSANEIKKLKELNEKGELTDDQAKDVIKNLFANSAKTLGSILDEKE